MHLDIVVTVFPQKEKFNFVSTTQIVLHLLLHVCSQSSPCLCVFLFIILCKMYCNSNSCSGKYTSRWIMLIILRCLCECY